MGAEAMTRLLRGRWYGRYGLAFCPAHRNTRTPALSLADGQDGRLLVHCFAACDPLDVLRMLPDQGAASGTPAAPHAALGRNERARTDAALAIWHEGGRLEGTLAERYLRGRAIVPPWPPALRFHASLWHANTRQRLPGLVALVTGPDGSPLAIHRTFLSPFGTKADIEPVKAMLGPCAGGAVRLSYGEGGLAVCEGVESGLSLRDHVPADIGVLAALSTAGIRGLKLPPEPGDLVIAPDGDAPGRRAAEALAQRAHGLGWQVRLLAAPDGRDWSDLAMEGQA